MYKHFRRVLLALPVVTMGAGLALADAPQPELAAAALAAPAPDHAATPCNGCAGHDCASCPLAIAAAQAQQAPAPAAEIHCGTN